MPAAVMAAAFEDRREADEVGIDIGERIDQRMPDARLRRQMDDGGKPVLREQRRDAVAVRQIKLDKIGQTGLAQFRQPRVFQ